MSARPVVMPAEEATMPLHRREPRRLGKYEVTGVLGEGAMGIVYRAIDPVIHRVVAIKAIRAPLLAPLADDLAAAQRFRNEARAAGRLNHPNIVSVYDFVENDGEALIVMEHVEGDSLLELTRAGQRLPLPDALSVVGQLLEALEVAHTQNVWHRDIKPANLLITPQGRLKVTDFGIARIESSHVTQQGKVIGSPGYMAPERYSDAPCDHRVDIFSAGVLLYELLTGLAPFRGSPSSVMNQVLTGSTPPASGLPIDVPPPPAFDAVMARALARDPQERFADAAAMREALVDAFAGALPPAVAVETLRRLRARPAQAPLPWPLQPAEIAPLRVPPPPAANTVPPRWDPKLLDRVTALLVARIGPVAVVVVRRAAAHCADLDALAAEVAVQSLPDDERAAFVAAARALAGRADAPAPSAPAPDGLPVLGNTPMDMVVVARAETWLLTQVGPIAKVLTRRAAAESATREQFFARLADRLAGDIDRRTLLAQLWRIAR